MRAERAVFDIAFVFELGELVLVVFVGVVTGLPVGDLACNVLVLG